MLDHRNLPKLIKFCENATLHKKDGQEVRVAYIVQELISGGELFDYIANSGRFSESVCKHVFR